MRRERYAETIKVLQAFLPKVDRQAVGIITTPEASRFPSGRRDQANEFINLGLKNLDANVPQFRFFERADYGTTRRSRWRSSIISSWAT